MLSAFIPISHNTAAAALTKFGLRVHRPRRQTAAQNIKYVFFCRAQQRQADLKFRTGRGTRSMYPQLQTELCSGRMLGTRSTVHKVWQTLKQMADLKCILTLTETVQCNRTD